MARRSPRNRHAARIALAISGSLLLACQAPVEPPPASAPETSEPPLIILISIDTLRADHLGSYGYSRDTSPVLDRLAEESIRFSSAFAPTPWTFPSHASMLTGMHPYEIGIDNSLRTIPDDIPIVAEHLKRAGYQTAAFVDSSPMGFVGADRGFERGFDLYQHGPHRADQLQRFDMATTVDAAIDWLDGRDPERPFFLFLHTKSVHAVPNDAECLDPRCFPYEKPAAWQFRYLSSEQATASWTTPQDGAGQRYLWSLNAKILAGELDPETYPEDHLEQLVAFYDAGINYVDAHFERLLEALRARDLYRRTVLVVTSDHGEAFLDHTLFMHQEVFDPVVQVPLILRLPQSSGSGVEDRHVMLSDIAPTLLQQARLPVPEQMTGRSLLMPEPELGTRGARDIFSYYFFPSKFTYQPVALRRGNWKLVAHNPDNPEDFSWLLFDLATDPEEQRPVASEMQRLAELKRSLRMVLRRPPLSQGAEIHPQDLPDLEAIRALGYIE
ncbi:MAG: sulfatase [Acidobacteriota bacterium]